ncbi:probable myosin-binding protein 6 isoform X3 [Brachypodium distachyon]|uniref:GTD-binding domain-containing protein n=2 Tax=Brachypodium distachyon TaxID=15368 RepID=I1HS64_BRADI|nr:probable myosin-binding protein 6 isoform X3 [Brachypodium distachyon]KQK10014.1 hypothetical protein BRADI_2g51510v3 [Brachypodium distachyon]|eukprot:XP_010232416.1 probable myosin-binding protein 6 isoform X3 [Brachypodium distachyon]
MGTRMTIPQRLPVALSSAFLEWILMLLLFIDAVYSFLVTKFARLCKLPVPCPFCSRLDHVLGNEEPCFYRELICKTHKSEISSLAFCRLHQKLAGVESMCEGCSSSSLAADEKPNNDDNTDEPKDAGDAFDSNRGDNDVIHSPLTRICSCCAERFEQRSISLFSRKIGELKPAEPANSPMICTDYSVSGRLDESLEAKDIYHQSDHTSHERYSGLQTTSDSKVEVPCADDGSHSHPHEAYDMETDLLVDSVVEKPVLPCPEVIKSSQGNVQKEDKVTYTGDISSAYPVLDDHDPDNVISASEMEAKHRSPERRASLHDPPIAIEELCLEDNVGDNHVLQVSADLETLVEVEGHPKEAEPIGDTGMHVLTSQDPSNADFEDMITKDFTEEAHIPPVAARSSGEVSQGLDAIEENPQTSETIDERRPSLSTQISMNEAYNLAIGIKGSLPSPTLTDVILGKGSCSSVNEELRLLLSQLSASRGLEATWVDPGPSPRAYGRGDDLIVQNITKRISIERNVSGLESLDGSIISEMEGESTIDRLRRQIDLDRKSIHLLCRELEEERNAAAIAASQALAMITRLQDEKAAMQMEASHYQRMMDEQAEYDSQALVEANELLAQREQQVEELEAELENYRTKFGDGGPTEKQDTQVPLKEQNTTTSFLEHERSYIAECLRKLEHKLQLYSNSTFTDLSNSDAIEYDLSDKMLDTLQCQKSSRETRDPVPLVKESQSPTMNGEIDVSTFQEEISNLHKRLKTLEGDRDFLEHSINSLRNGKEGVLFIREIACNLRQLRGIAIDR